MYAGRGLSTMAYFHTSDTQDHILLATRVRKVPDTASAAVAAAAGPEGLKQMYASTDAIRKWAIQHKAVATLPATMPVDPMGQILYVKLCALNLAALVR